MTVGSSSSSNGREKTEVAPTSHVVPAAAAAAAAAPSAPAATAAVGAMVSNAAPLKIGRGKAVTRRCEVKQPLRAASSRDLERGAVEEGRVEARRVVDVEHRRAHLHDQRRGQLHLSGSGARS